MELSCTTCVLATYGVAILVYDSSDLGLDIVSIYWRRGHCQRRLKTHVVSRSCIWSMV